MTLAEVAEETSFTAGYLSQIENGQAVPALSALADIAAALGADVAAFFPADEAPRVRARAGDTRRIRIESIPPPSTSSSPAAVPTAPSPR